MTTKPSHTAYIVSEPSEGADRKSIWHPIGTVWSHKNGDGFDLVLPPGVTVSGRIVCTKRKEQQPD